MGIADPYLLLSIKHGPEGQTAIWWGPGYCGYTPNLSEAGRYTKREAECRANEEHPGLQSCYAVREADIAHLINRVDTSPSWPFSG